MHPTWQKTKPDLPEDKHFGWAFFSSGEQESFVGPSGYGSFAPSECTVDPNVGAKFIRDLYERSDDKFFKYTVPVLWDKQTSTIVNNESSEIVRMLTKEFDAFATGPFAHLDLYPESLRGEIDAVNEWVYSGINDGVYKCGFAKSQAAYDESVTQLFASLDRVEEALSTSRYLVTSSPAPITEADIRLFMTLVRFDEVYVVYFKCNVKRMVDYPNIRNYMRDLYQLPGVKESVNMEHIKMHYFT